MQRTVAIAALLAAVTAAIAAEPTARPQSFLAIGPGHRPPPVFAPAEGLPPATMGEPTIRSTEGPTAEPSGELAPRPLVKPDRESENLWLLCPTERLRLLEEFERQPPDPGHYIPPLDCEQVEEVCGRLGRVYRTHDDLRMYRMHRARLKSPGPTLIGSFDQEMLYWMGPDLFSEQPFALGYRGRRYFDADASGQSGEMGFVRQDAFIRSDTTSFPCLTFLKARTLTFDPRPRLPDEGGRFPDMLADLQAGLFIPWLAPVGLWNVTFGSASDKPFASGREMTWDVTWTMFGIGAFGWGEPDTFVFFINWQTNRDFCNNVPLPGFVYRYRQGDWFTLVLGFPDNAIAWRPTEQFELAASYKFPRTVYSRVSYLPRPNLRLFAGFEWENLRFYRHDRHSNHDRLWYDEKRLLAGARVDLSEGMYLEGSLGWASDRMWFEGETYEDRSFNRIDVEGGFFGGVQLVLRF